MYGIKLCMHAVCMYVCVCLCMYVYVCMYVCAQDYFDDFEFSYPLSWFDPEWECGYMGNGDANTSTIPCNRSP